MTLNSAISENGEFSSVMNNVWSGSSLGSYIPTALGVFPICGTGRSHRCHTLCPSKPLLSSTAWPWGRRSPPSPPFRLQRPPLAPRPRRGRQPRLRLSSLSRERPYGGGTGRLDRRDSFPPRLRRREPPSSRGFPERGGRNPAGGQAPGRTGAEGRCSSRPQRRAGALRPFPGRPRLLPPAPGRAAGSGRGAPAASRPPPPSCSGPATWPAERGGETWEPGEAGREAAAGGRRRAATGPWLPLGEQRRSPPSPAEPAAARAARHYLSKSSRIMKMQKARGKAR